MKIPLEPGDRVVAAFPFREWVIVVTQYGTVFKITISEDPSEEKMRCVHTPNICISKL